MSAQFRMAYRFAGLYADEFRYVHSRGTPLGWIGWNGTYHSSDDPGAHGRAT